MGTGQYRFDTDLKQRVLSQSLMRVGVGAVDVPSRIRVELSLPFLFLQS